MKLRENEADMASRFDYLLSLWEAIAVVDTVFVDIRLDCECYG